MSKISIQEFRALPLRDGRGSENTLRAVGESAFAAQMVAQVKPEGARVGRGKGWNKYSAKKVVTNEGVFDSKIEYKRWCELKLLRDSGQIQFLERQIPYTLEVNGLKICRFTIDHKWLDMASGQWCYEDVKGVLVRDFMLRVKLIKAIHGIDVQVWPERKKRGKKK